MTTIKPIDIFTMNENFFLKNNRKDKINKTITEIEKWATRAPAYPLPQIISAGIGCAK